MSAVREVQEIRALLESDLYKPVPPLEGYAQGMESPLGWRVDWRIMGRTEETPGPGARVRLRIGQPDGKEYKLIEDATASGLDYVLP